MMNAGRIVPGRETRDAIEAVIARDPELTLLWRMTLQVLDGRPGWALYLDEDGIYAWFFGWEGQGLLVVSVEPYGLQCFHHREDTDTTANSARELWEWAKGLEDVEEEEGAKYLMEFKSSVRQDADMRLAVELPA